MADRHTQRPLRVGVLGAGPIAQAAHFDALTKARNAELFAICDLAEDLLAQMSAVHRPTRTFTDYHCASEVECFAAKDRRYHRPLDEDAHFWRRQVEGFADSILTGAPQLGANVDDGLAAMRVIDAIERSVETGAAVEIDPA